jgi:hypothetical protein
MQHINRAETQKKEKINKSLGDRRLNGQARVKQISSKMKEYWLEGEQYDTVVLHVGTNNLVSEDPEAAEASRK